MTDDAAARAATTRPTAPGSGRVEAFSDGVFAIAITLLVLEVKVPEVEGGHGLTKALLHQWPSYVAYAVSFLTIGIMWINHHAIFDRVRLVDRGLLYRNMLLLGSVSFLPFPTAVLARYLRGGDNARPAAVAYGATMVIVGLAFTLIWQHLLNRPVLWEAHVTEAGVRSARFRSGIGPLIYLVATGVAAIAPIAALAIYGLIAGYFAFTRHRS